MNTKVSAKPSGLLLDYKNEEDSGIFRETITFKDSLLKAIYFFESDTVEAIMLEFIIVSNDYVEKSKEIFTDIQTLKGTKFKYLLTDEMQSNTKLLRYKNKPSVIWDEKNKGVHIFCYYYQ